MNRLKPKYARPGFLYLTLLLLCLGTAGCTSVGQWLDNGFKVGPNYRRPCGNTAGEWLEEPEPLIQETAGDYRAWWTTFRDPVLDQLVDMTYHQNLSLKAACWRIQEARALRAVAVGNLFPQEQYLGGGFNRLKLSRNAYPNNLLPLPKSFFDQANGGFNAAWELDFWGRFRRLVEAADANLQVQVANYNQALVLLQAEIAGNYVQLRAFDERLALAYKNVKLQTNTVRIIDRRFQEGLVSELDIRQAKSNLAITESLIPNLEAARRQTHNRICVLVGMPPTDISSLLGPAGTIPTAPAEVAVGIPADLLRRRPDVRAAERQLAAQSAKIGIATSELYPHIAITGSLGVESEKFSNLFTQRGFTGSIGPNFRWNVLNYGRILSNIRVEDAVYQQACYSYLNTILTANEEVENSISNYIQETIRVRTLLASVQETERAEHLALLQYEQGLIDYQRLLDTQRVLVQTQDRHAESRGLVALNLVLLYKALGGGWQTYYPECGMPMIEADAALAAPPEPIPALAPTAEEAAEEPAEEPADKSKPAKPVGNQQTAVPNLPASLSSPLPIQTPPTGMVTNSRLVNPIVNRPTNPIPNASISPPFPPAPTTAAPPVEPSITLRLEQTAPTF